MSCWGNLGIIFPRERDFGTFFDGFPSKRMLPVNWETSRSRIFSKDRSHSNPRWKRRVSNSSLSRSLFLFLLHILDLVVFLPCLIHFLFSFGNLPSLFPVSMKNCCSGWVGLLPIQLLFFFIRGKFMRSWPGVSLSMKDCGAASRAAKSLLRSSSERLEGFSLFEVQICFLRFYLQFCSSSSPPCWKTLGTG